MNFEILTLIVIGIITIYLEYARDTCFFFINVCLKKIVIWYSTKIGYNVFDSINVNIFTHYIITSNFIKKINNVEMYLLKWNIDHLFGWHSI